jgi:hypothetical protein
MMAVEASKKLDKDALGGRYFFSEESGFLIISECVLLFFFKRTKSDASAPLRKPLFRSAAL